MIFLLKCKIPFGVNVASFTLNIPNNSRLFFSALSWSIYLTFCFLYLLFDFNLQFLEKINAMETELLDIEQILTYKLKVNADVGIRFYVPFFKYIGSFLNLVLAAELLLKQGNKKNFVATFNK